MDRARLRRLLVLGPPLQRPALERPRRGPQAHQGRFRSDDARGAHWTFLADRDLAVQHHFDINEYTDVHHDNAGVPHTVILSPGLRIEHVYVGYWFWGRPSNDRLWNDLGEVLKRTKADFDPTTPEARAAWQQMRLAA